MHTICEHMQQPVNYMHAVCKRCIFFKKVCSRLGVHPPALFHKQSLPLPWGAASGGSSSKKYKNKDIHRQINK